MIQLLSNATVMWTEEELRRRECTITMIYSLIKKAWTDTNKAIAFIQVETPILTPSDMLSSHMSAGFPLQYVVAEKVGAPSVALRPETTAGTIAAFEKLYPQKPERAKRLPVCLWQHGKSFRTETNPNTMRASKLRLREFNQLEFQLFTAEGTKADYITIALTRLIAEFGGTFYHVPKEELPHYSSRTTDWILNDLEVAGCSQRTDWAEGMLFEISIGLDRLVALNHK